MNQHLNTEEPQEQKPQENRTTLSGNALRMGAALLTFALLGPAIGAAVGLLALVDYKAQGRFSEAGKNVFLGVGNIAESMLGVAKSITEKLFSPEQKQKATLESCKLQEIQGFSPHITAQAKEYGAGLKESIDNALGDNIKGPNLTHQQSKAREL